MAGRLVAWSLRHRLLVVSIVVALAAVAVWFNARMRFDALPDITPNQVVVLTRAPGLTPEEVELRVTRPLETAAGGLPGVVGQRSISRYGISAVTLVFDDAVDPYLARQLVQERLNVVAGELPEAALAPELGPLTSGLGEILHFTLTSPTRTPAELQELASLRVAPILRTVPGVVEVNTWGGGQRTLDAVARPADLARHGLTLRDLRGALEEATGSAPGANLPAGGSQALLRAMARPAGASDLGAAVVARREGAGGAAPSIVRVADVADVVDGQLPRIGAATVNGRGEAVYVMVQMLRDDNALEVMSRLHEAMPGVADVLPDDVALDLVYDRSHLVTRTLTTVAKNLLEGGLLVVAVLFAMLGSLRAGLLVALVIPLSMLGAVVGMVLLDIPGNLMSLGAIDFGLLVDGAVVMVEGIFHDLKHDWDGKGLRRHRIAAVATGLARPVFFSVLVIVLVYVPVLLLQGVDGKMFRPMALTVVMALTTSLVLALTFVPAGASLFIRERDVPDRDPLLVRAARRGYAPLLDLSVRHPLPVVLAAAALLAVGGWLYARAGSTFVPQLDEGDLVIQTTRNPDISIETAAEKATAMEAALLGAIPEVAQVVSRVGSPAVATDIMGLEQADVFVRLAPREAWRAGLTRDALIEEIQGVLDREDPGGDPAFTQPIQMRFNELLEGSVTDVAISVFGDDLAALREVADAVVAAVEPVPGAADVRVLAPPDVSLVEVTPRALDAATHGFTARDVLDAIQALRVGLDVGVTYEGLLTVPIRLRLAGDPAATTLGDLSLAAPTGSMVPLSRVAEVRHLATPSMVSHDDGQRRVVVGFNIRGRDLGDVVADARARVAAEVSPRDGVRLAWGGQIETLEEARDRMAVLVPGVILLILALLVVTFGQVRPALIILAHVPFAGVGGMIALGLRDMPISISAGVGFIALSGIAVLNGVVLMSRLLALVGEGHPPGEAAVLAARSRMRAVLMTALVAALGFVPMMLATGVGAEVQRPLATVVVGGLVTSTLLTLLVLPSVYAWAAGGAGARRRTAS